MLPADLQLRVPADWLRIGDAAIVDADAGLKDRVGIWVEMNLRLGRRVTERYSTFSRFVILEAWDEPTKGALQPTKVGA